MRIRAELLRYKAISMLVHPDSVKYTNFHQALKKQPEQQQQEQQQQQQQANTSMQLQGSTKTPTQPHNAAALNPNNNLLKLAHRRASDMTSAKSRQQENSNNVAKSNLSPAPSPKDGAARRASVNVAKIMR